MCKRPVEVRRVRFDYRKVRRGPLDVESVGFQYHKACSSPVEFWRVGFEYFKVCKGPVEVWDRLSSHSSMKLCHKTSCGSSPFPQYNRDSPLST